MAGPGRGPKGPVQKPQDAGKTIRRVFSYMDGYQKQMVLILIGLLLNAAAGVAGAYFLKPLINNCIVPYVGQQNPDLSQFISTLGAMACIYLVGAAGSFLYNRLMINVATGTLYRIRTDLFTKMEKLPLRYFDSHPHGELMSRFTNDTDTLREMISNALPHMISSVVSVVGVFTMMLLLSPILTAIIVIMLFLMLKVVMTLGGKSGMYFKKQQGALGKVNGYIEEMIEGQKVVKVFCHEDKTVAHFRRINDELCDAATNAHTFASILMPIMGNLSHMVYALIAAAGGGIAIAFPALMDLGTIAAFLQYTRSFYQPITQISQLFNSILTALAGAERIFGLIDQEPELDEGKVTLVYAEKVLDEAGREAAGENGLPLLKESSARTGLWAWKVPAGTAAALEAGGISLAGSPAAGGLLVQVRGDVRFADVTFSYDGKKTVLHDVSLYAKPGQKIAFVGSTGAGKTTITNLINRFYDVDEGAITYDGIPVKEIRKDDLRRSLAMVLQDTHLFTGTVKENIRYGKLDATDEEIVRAAKLANAHWFIQHLPQGYDTVLTADGANLSQGQRQLLAIARAAVADPPVLILDEATSSIDTRTEALIEKGMDSLMEGRTVFVIAHRLSTVRNSNAIMVLEHGRIIERGDHDDLLQQKGKYYQLYTGMFELS
ncbi:MAG: ABC transporter ATP-binding protein [Clostridiales bacterium]|nr:ABC transporter ATP-binding protein [Clostridiales bacterium]